MTLVGMSQAIVGREHDGGHVTRRDTLRTALVTLQAEFVHSRAQQARIRRNVRVVASQAISRGVGKMRVGKHLGPMTLKADNGLRLFDNDVTRVLAVLDRVTGRASQFDSGMNVIARRLFGMTFQGVCVLVHWRGMYPCVTQTRA